MEEFKKVEELAKITGVSFEDAKDALRACNGDMTDAMVYLEKLGKVNTNNISSQPNKSFDNVKEPVGKFVNYMTKNKFNIQKEENTIVKVPVGVAIIFGIAAAPITVPAILVSMACGYEYSLSGENNMDKINQVVDKVENVTVKVKDECVNLVQNDNTNKENDVPIDNA